MIPSRDPSKPSYEAGFYTRVQSKLQLVADIYSGTDSWQETDRFPSYLPMEEAESHVRYAARSSRAPFVPFFAHTTNNLADLLSDFSLDGNIHPSFEEWQTDVDGRGSTITAFLREADRRVLRDGLVGIMVDFPKTDNLTSRAQELALQPHPYLSLIDRRNIINARGETVGGKFRLTQITIRESATIPDGDFGETIVTRYRVLDSVGNYKVYEWDGSDFPLIDEGRYSLGRMPLVLYSFDMEPLEAVPPLYAIAKLNISHFQAQSDLVEVQHLINLPLLVTIGRYDDEPIVVSAGAVIGVGENGDAKFIEPSGNAIASTLETIRHLEGQMASLTVAFMQRSEGAKTATQSSLESAQSSATLKGLAEGKQSAVEQILSYWSMWMGGSEDGGTIAINADVFSGEITPDMVRVYTDLFSIGLLSRDAVLQILVEKGLMAKGFDLEKELALSNKSTEFDGTDDEEVEDVDERD